MEQKGIPVKKLLEDGIALHKGDVLFGTNCTDSGNPFTTVDNPYWVGETGLNLYKSIPSIFEGKYLHSFAERKNVTGKRPVSDWVVVVLENKDKCLAAHLCWDLEYWTKDFDGYNTNSMWWKPDFNSLYEHYNKAPESDSKPSKSERGTMNHLDSENSSEKLAEAATYTKEMYDQGILPEVGSLVYYEMPYSNEVRGGVVTMLTFFQGIVRVMVGTVSIPLKDLVFPEPEKTLEEKVVDKMEKFFENNFGCFDEDIVMNTYKAFKDIEKELQDD